MAPASSSTPTPLRLGVSIASGKRTRQSSARSSTETERIRAFQRSQPECGRCCECGDYGPTYIVMDFGAFVCTECAGLHRELSHRVKGISISSWTTEEVDWILQRGNPKVDAEFLSSYDGSVRKPLPGERQHIRSWIDYKYARKQWVAKLNNDGTHEHKTTTAAKPSKASSASTTVNSLTDYSHNSTTATQSSFGKTKRGKPASSVSNSTAGLLGRRGGGTDVLPAPQGSSRDFQARKARPRKGQLGNNVDLLGLGDDVLGPETGAGSSHTSGRGGHGSPTNRARATATAAAATAVPESLSLVTTEDPFAITAPSLLTSATATAPVPGSSVDGLSSSLTFSKTGKGQGGEMGQTHSRSATLGTEFVFGTADPFQANDGTVTTSTARVREGQMTASTDWLNFATDPFSFQPTKSHILGSTQVVAPSSDSNFKADVVVADVGFRTGLNQSTGSFDHVPDAVTGFPHPFPSPSLAPDHVPQRPQSSDLSNVMTQSASRLSFESQRYTGDPFKAVKMTTDAISREVTLGPAMTVQWDSFSPTPAATQPSSTSASRAGNTSALGPLEISSGQKEFLAEQLASLALACEETRVTSSAHHGGALKQSPNAEKAIDTALSQFTDVASTLGQLPAPSQGSAKSESEAVSSFFVPITSGSSLLTGVHKVPKALDAHSGESTAASAFVAKTSIETTNEPTNLFGGAAWDNAFTSATSANKQTSGWLDPFASSAGPAAPIAKLEWPEAPLTSSKTSHLNHFTSSMLPASNPWSDSIVADASQQSFALSGGLNTDDHQFLTSSAWAEFGDLPDFLHQSSGLSSADAGRGGDSRCAPTVTSNGTAPDANLGFQHF